MVECSTKIRGYELDFHFYSSCQKGYKRNTEGIVKTQERAKYTLALNTIHHHSSYFQYNGIHGASYRVCKFKKCDFEWIWYDLFTTFVGADTMPLSEGLGRILLMYTKAKPYIFTF